MLSAAEAAATTWPSPLLGIFSCLLLEEAGLRFDSLHSSLPDAITELFQWKCLVLWSGGTEFLWLHCLVLAFGNVFDKKVCCRVSVPR